MKDFSSKLSYDTLNIQQIAAWCQKNNQVEWLKEIASRQVPYTVYPRKKVLVTDALGNPVLTKKRKPKYTTIADKSQAPKIEMRAIGFIQIKKEFIDTFLPELKPVKKEKAPTMYDFINSL